MAVIFKLHFIFSVLLPLLFYRPSSAVKCFNCNSANNSACLDMHLPKLQAVIPIVDCERVLPSSVSKQFFCRKITQTILHVDKSPETRITRGCGWIKHKRQCYTADNKDHLETVCQCFGDMCNAAATLNSFKVTAVAALAAILLSFTTWRGNVLV